jgi:hypothetical protein
MEQLMTCDACRIKNLIYRYADSIDRGKLDVVADLFKRGRLIAVDGAGNDQEMAGADAISAVYAAFTRLYEDDGTPHTQHLTSNVIVEVEEGGQRAAASCYAVVFQAVEDFPLQPIIGVRYQDVFEKTEDQWHFASRRIETRLTGDLSRHLLQPV